MEQVVNRKYRLGLRGVDPGMSALSSTGLHEHAHAYLEELRQRTRYAASIAVLDGADVLYVDRVPSLRRAEREIGVTVRTGSRLPAYCTAPGKVLLAGLPAHERELIGGLQLRRRGPNTITTKKALRAEIDHVQEEGMAVDDKELAQGLVAISVPVFDEDAEVAAAASLEAPAHAISLEGLIDGLASHLSASAQLISARLGYRRADEAYR